MKASPVRLSVVLVSLVVLALAAPSLREQVRLYGEVDGLLALGAANLNQGRIDDAERAWTRAAQLAPRNPTVQHALGSLYLASGRWDAARQALHRFADLAPEEPHALCELAEQELNTGSLRLLEPASWDAARAAALEPTCLRAQLAAANAWLARGDDRRGIRYLQRAAALDPGTPAHRVRMVRLLLRSQRLPEAIRTASELSRKYPGSSAAWGVLGECYAQCPPDSPEGRQAAAVLLQAVRLDPLNGAAHASLGRLLVTRGMPGAALPHLEAARELGSSDVSLLFNLGRAYRATGRVAEASRVEAEFQRLNAIESELAALEKRLAVNPDEPGALERLLRLAEALHDPGRRERYRRLVAQVRQEKRP